ncbi:hypothetical protein L1987_80842 [Smallanthus sonchifolius]|uniref:Uncharacterized protein n=1 Tax=Smallanthus sonchifolius TaxID=185202 RepID=A0ACB8YPI2_9ASTR|nr:hypothetical protein L1987_80842 [Smallanthus sonchifolius]
MLINGKFLRSLKLRKWDRIIQLVLDYLSRKMLQSTRIQLATQLYQSQVLLHAQRPKKLVSAYDIDRDFGIHRKHGWYHLFFHGAS